MKDYYGRDNVLNTLAFKTLTSKSAILTACRGLGINDDVAHTLANYVPMERGFSWSLKECFEGNEEAGRQKIQAFINEVDSYSHLHLKETMLGLENLICGRSIHASAVYMYEDGYIKQNSLMRAPNGTRITAFNMTDSDVLGGLKMDCLTVVNMDKMQTAMKLLIEAGVIEDQGSLKATYDKYLHPDVLEYDDPEMWKKIGNNEVLSLFQFDSAVGQQAAQKIKPASVKEMADANTLMRLMAGDGEESPIDVYVRYKNDISLWYEEMRQHGLTDDEVKVMEDHLLSSYGLAIVQEDVMQLSMDERISGFTMTEANKLRKGISKKKKAVIEEMEKLFYQKCKERGTSDALARYVWDVQMRRQFGYGFNLAHAIPYSVIGLQNLNLAYRYNPIYWNTACLTVDAGADTDNDANDVTDYGKIATAIGVIRKRGQVVSPPLINRAKFDFWPDSETNEIIFSLKALRGLGDTQAESIIKNQPFVSFEDFLDRTADEVKPSSVIALIKAGAFDEQEPSRRELMRKYMATLAPTVSKLTLKHLPELKASGIVSVENYRLELTAYAYSQYIKQTTPAITGKTPGTIWHYVMGKRGDEDFFNVNLAPLLKIDKDYKRHSDGYLIVKQSALDRATKKLLEPLKTRVLDDPGVIQQVNDLRAAEFMQEKCPGTLSSWEMESMCFYHGRHELANVNESRYNISDFNMLPPTPVARVVTRGNRSYETKIMYNLAGTVIDRNKNKHIVTLLTTHGVVTLKFFRDNFIQYNEQISEVNEAGEKHVVEKSWFSRGSKILVHGFRREDQFVVRPEKKSNSVDIPAVSLITVVDEDTGAISLKRYREKIEVPA